MKTYLCKKCSTQEDSGPIEDDWEPYEEAALLREREAAIEREMDMTDVKGRKSCENSKIPASNVSLPTNGF